MQNFQRSVVTKREFLNILRSAVTKQAFSFQVAFRSDVHAAVHLG